MHWRDLATVPFTDTRAHLKALLKSLIIIPLSLAFLWFGGRKTQVSDQAFWILATLTASVFWYLWSVLMHVLRERTELSKWQQRAIGASFALLCALVFLFGRLGTSTGANPESRSRECADLIPDQYWMTEDQTIGFVTCMVEHDKLGPVYDWLVRRMVARATLHGLHWQMACDSTWSDVWNNETDGMFSRWRGEGSRSFRETNDCDIRFLTAEVANGDWRDMYGGVNKLPPDNSH
jgi:hypothetical protein